MKAATAVKQKLQQLLRQQSEQELSARETELAEHITEREALRLRLADDAAANAAEQARHDAARAALAEFGERHSWQQRNEDRELIAEGRRLCEAVNRLPAFVRYAPGYSPKERLVGGCKDPQIQSALTTARAALQEAAKALATVQESSGTLALRASAARRDRLELLGSIQRQFGREGGRWRRVESGDEVSIEGLQDAAGEPAIHPENLAFLNRQLAPLNRRIREYLQQLEGSEVQRLRAAVAKAEGALAVVEAKAIESEV
jgi:hypothetical protein